MIFLAAVTVAQLALGPEGSRVILSMSGWSQALFSCVLFAGAGLALASMFVTGRLGARMEAAGLFGCAISLCAYALPVVDITAAWITNPAFAFGGIGLGCADRAGLLLRRC